MSGYEFTLDLRDPLTDEQVDGLYGGLCDDCLAAGGPSFTGQLHFEREGKSFATTVLGAIADAETVSGVRVASVSPEELVTAAEIAARLGRSRESVRLLAAGKRGDGTFPAPVGRIDRRSPLWRWADVARWNGHEDPDAATLAFINAALTVRSTRADVSPESAATVEEALLGRKAA